MSLLFFNSGCHYHCHDLLMGREQATSGPQPQGHIWQTELLLGHWEPQWWLSMGLPAGWCFTQSGCEQKLSFSSQEHSSKNQQHFKGTPLKSANVCLSASKFSVPGTQIEGT